MVVVDLALELQPNCKARPARNNPSSNDITIFLRRENATPPNPRKANPENGSQVAKNGLCPGRTCVVVVSLAVVLRVSTEVGDRVIDEFAGSSRGEARATCQRDAVREAGAATRGNRDAVGHGASSGRGARRRIHPDCEISHSGGSGSRGGETGAGDAKGGAVPE